jgi:DNA-binding transcriptional LysR family regulator
LSGTLRVAGSAFFVSHHVVPIIRDFSLQHPGVRFDLRISEEFAEPIRTGFDLMIRIGQLPASLMKMFQLSSAPESERLCVLYLPSVIGRRLRSTSTYGGHS